MTPDLMKLIAGGGGQGQKPAAPAPAPMGTEQNSPPVGAPMATPQPMEGAKQSAMINISMAMDLLEQSLGPLGSESEEGQAVLSAISGLSRKFGASKKKAEGLVPAEIMQLMQQLPQAGGGSQVAKSMAGAGMPPAPHPQGAMG